MFDRGDEFGGAVDELGGFLRARRRSLIVAFLASVLGAPGEGAESLVELARRDEDLTEQGPGPAVRFCELAALGEGGAGRLEHSVIGGADDHRGMGGSDDRLGIREAIARLLHELPGTRTHSHSLPARTILSRSTSWMKNESILRRPRSHWGSWVWTEKENGLSPSARAAASLRSPTIHR
jgi:hypothetical protein